MIFNVGHHLTVTVGVLLVSLSLIAIVSGLLDGGDFVSQDGGQKVINSPEDNRDSAGFCPAVTFESLLFDHFLCSADSKPQNLNGNTEERIQNSHVKDDIAPRTVDILAEAAEAAKDFDDTVVTPVIVIPPLIVKATPKEMTSFSVVSPPEETPEKAELETETEPVTEPDAHVEKIEEAEAETEFKRKESAVEEEPVIAPFSQWAEKKLEEAAMKDATKKDEPEVEFVSGVSTKPSSSASNGKANGVFKMSKNFASPDCSAKIVGANSASQGSGNVITSSRDEYFLNKCTDKAWFVVELCESIKAVKIQLANFELYSSSPNQFKVSVANVFPGRDKDWMEFGTFSYQDERNTQTFVNEAGVVGKYVKVEVLSHHGAEHYCPVSLFKVFGIPEIDLISEDDNDEDGSEESPDISSEDEPKNHPIVQSIKDAVHKVVNVFRPQNVSIVETLNTSSLQGASLRFRLRPEAGDKYDQEVINRYHMIYYLLATQYTRVKEYSRIINLHRALPFICPEFGIEFPRSERTEETASGYPWQFLSFVRLYHGEDFLVAMCNLESMEQGESRLVMWTTATSSTNTTSTRAPADNKTQVSSDTAEDRGQPAVQTQREVRPDNKTSPLTEEVTEAALEAATEAESVQPVTTPEQTKPPEIAKPASSSSSAAGQTTWQKLSSRIKALERNVTLSTGFLEELSLKYIKQIEELNTAVKVANEAIQGIYRREEFSKDRTDRLVTQVESLTMSVASLEGRLLELQDELLARHGLLILGELLVIGLVLLLCRSDPARRKESSVSLAQDNRRRSLDTMRDNRQKMSERLETRRRSFEVGCLGNGQLGAMLQQTDSGLGLTKKQKKRKRRKDSKNLTTGLRHLSEEMESDNSNHQEAGLVAEPDNSDIIAMQSTPRKAGTVMSVHGVQDLSWRSKEVKTVRFPPAKKLSFSQSAVPPTQVSNIFSMLDNSVHDLSSSACDTETEEKKNNLRNLNRQKFIRSKSSSPNRQENLLKRQREAIRSFQPEQAEWLQKKSDC